jgi:hypothetical protein
VGERLRSSSWNGRAPITCGTPASSPYRANKILASFLRSIHGLRFANLAAVSLSHSVCLCLQVNEPTSELPVIRKEPGGRRPASGDHFRYADLALPVFGGTDDFSEPENADQGRKSGGLLPPTRVVDEEARVRLTPILEYSD